MALIYDNKIFRNLQEQVEKNKQDIVDLQQTEMALNAYGIKVVGQVETALDIPEDFEGDYGDAYLVGDEAPYDVYVWTRPNSETPEDHFVDIGPIAIIGPQGPQGPQGETGATGAQGIGWITGTDQSSTTGLPDGTLNFNGLNGNIYKLVSGSWTLIGSIKGPQGIQGAQGPTGATGATGAQGPQGPKGDTGSSYIVIGTYAATANLPDPTLVNPGSAALVGASVPYELYIVVGATQDAQLWQDVGVFNEQAESGTPIIEITAASNTLMNLTQNRQHSLTNEQEQMFLDNIGKDVIVIVKNSTNSTFYIFSKRSDTVTATRKDSYFVFILDKNHIVTAAYTDYNHYFTTHTVAELELVENKVKTSTELYNARTYDYKYTSTKSVYDYVQPYIDQIPLKSATLRIQGGKDLNDITIIAYANKEAREQWLALVNGLLSTNYTYSQMLAYIETAIGSLGQAPSTNFNNILELVLIFTLMPMTTGKFEFRNYLNGVLSEALIAQNTLISITTQTWASVFISGTAGGLSSEVLGTKVSDTLLYALGGDPFSLTDSDALVPTVTNYIS